MYIWWKSLFKQNPIIRNFLSTLIYYYLKILYSTARLKFEYTSEYNSEMLQTATRTIFVLWHNKLALGPCIFKQTNNTAALVSSHSDGRIISNVISRFGFDIIEGSTNRNSLAALRTIMKMLALNQNVVVTPDGPRGPCYKINSNITQIAQKSNAKLIPISYTASNYFTLNSWDNLIMPIPFCKILIKIGSPLPLTSTRLENDADLEKRLMDLL